MEINNSSNITGQTNKRPHHPNFTFAAKLATLDTEELEEIAKMLNQLGLQFDPFSSTQNEEDMQLIKSLSLELFLDDPFQFTNIILKRLDDIETELKKRKP